MSGITVTEDGTLTLTELTQDDITSLLADTREKGIYEAICTDFAACGDLYLIVSADTRLVGKEQAAIVQSLKLNIAKCEKKHGAGFPTLKIVKKGDNTILVNKTVHDAAIAAASTDSE